MGGKDDATLQRVVLDDVVDEQIVMAFRGLVADQDAVGIAGDEVAGHDRIDGSHQVKGATAVPGFIGLINPIAGLAGTTRKCPRELEARCCVIVFDGVVADGNVRSAHDQDAFK